MEPGRQFSLQKWKVSVSDLRLDHRITLLAYLTLKCLALFSLIWIAFSIHPSWGTPVLIALGFSWSA